MVLLAATAALAHRFSRTLPTPLALPLERIDNQILGWNVQSNQTLPDYTLRALKPTSYLSRTYTKGKENLDLFVAFYAQQRSGESMHSPKHCLPGSGWEIWRLGSTSVTDQEWGQTTVNKYSIQYSGKRMLMFYWYQSADRIVADEYRAKVLLARDTLLTGRTAGSIVRFTLPDNEWASAEGDAFAAKLIPIVRRCFRGDAPVATLR
ncbi:MAG: EpsI family protein [Bryobacterales bacterium]|nr:EpsI family protein [Bryobacterales bacterium]